MAKTNEASLKDRLVERIRALRPTATVIRHEDRITAGVPDLSVTWNRRTSWWEVKFAKPRIESRGVQDYTVLQLAANGYARHIVFKESSVDTTTHGDRKPVYTRVQRVFVLHPRYLEEAKAKNIDPEVFAEANWDGFNYEAVARHILGVHEQ